MGEIRGEGERKAKREDEGIILGALEGNVNSVKLACQK